jgi:hypothetical protein
MVVLETEISLCAPFVTDREIRKRYCRWNNRQDKATVKLNSSLSVFSLVGFHISLFCTVERNNTAIRCKVKTAMESWETPIPTKLLVGNGCLSRFDHNHEKHKTGTTQAQGHHMLPSKNTRYNSYDHQHIRSN